MKSALLKATSVMKIGLWNVRTMYDATKTAQVIKERDRYHLVVLGISERRWTKLHFRETSNTIIFENVDDRHEAVVAILMLNEADQTLTE